MYFYNEPYAYPNDSSNEFFYQNRQYIHDTLASFIVINSRTHPREQWLYNPEMKLMLSLLGQIKNVPALLFAHGATKYGSEDIEYYSHAGNIPSNLRNASNKAPEIPSLVICHNKRGQEIFASLDKHLTDLKHISLALQTDRHHKIRVYKDIEVNTISIMTNRFDWTLMRKLIALLPKFFPEQFVLDEEVAEILTLFGGDDADTWQEAYINWFNKHDFITEFKKQQFISTFKNLKSVQKDKLKREIESYGNSVKEYLKNLQDCYKYIQDKRLTLQALELQENQDPTELFSYLKKNTMIKDWEAFTDGILHLHIISPVVYFEPNALKMYYKHNSSCISENPFYSRLFREIFLEEKYVMYTETHCNLNLNTGTIQRHDGRSCNEAIQQPHIMPYNCWGNNAPTITKLVIQEQNFIGAIEQIVAATENINFVDTTVISKFVELLRDCTKDMKFIKDPEGNMFSLYDLKNIFKKETVA